MNTEFPESLTIPEVLKIPDGNVFKFVLYGIGVIDYKFNASDSTWSVCAYFIISRMILRLYIAQISSNSIILHLFL